MPPAVLLDSDDTFAVVLVANVSAEDCFVVDHLSVFAERFETLLDESRANFCGDLFGVKNVGVDFDDFDQVSSGMFEGLEMADFDFHG